MAELESAHSPVRSMAKRRVPGFDQAGNRHGSGEIVIGSLQGPSQDAGGFVHTGHSVPVEMAEGDLAAR